MALVPVEQLVTNTRTGAPRAFARRIRSKAFAAGTGTLAILSAITRATATGFWQLWAALVSEIDTITSSGTVTGGTFTISVDGATTAAIAWNASNTTILAALLALPNLQAGDVILTGGGATGVATGVLTLTFAGRQAGKAIVVAVTSSVTGSATPLYTLAQVTAGVQAVDGTEKITGFVWPDAVVLTSSGQVIGDVMEAGAVNAFDVPLNSVSQANMNLGLQDAELRRMGLYIEGLQGTA